MKKTQKENANQEPPTLDGQISLEDIFTNADDGTYGKPSDEYEVRS